MKKLGILAMSVAVLGLYSCSNDNSNAENANADVYQLAVDKSDIVWLGEYIKDGAFDHSHEGELLFNSGSISIIDGQVVGGEFELNMKSIKELNAPWGEEQAAKLEGHLKSEDYFDVEKFPTAKVVITGSKDGNIQGTINVRGVDVPFDVAMKVTVDEAGVVLSGSFDFDFSPFGMDGIGGEGEYVAPKVNIDVYAEFTK
jgi:polyisoprenoid-binding protein YceI